MSNRIPVAACLVIALVLGACAQASPSAAPSLASGKPLGTAAVASGPATASAPAASPAIPLDASPSPTSFTSTTYGYSLTVPAGWTVIQATRTWDGKGAPAHEAPESDQFVGPAAASAWFVGVPTSKDLAGRVAESVAGNAADHSDSCPPVPEVHDQIEIGGQPAVLVGWNCGILINLAITVHQHTAYVFGWRDPGVHAASDQADRALFLALLGSVRFPD